MENKILTDDKIKEKIDEYNRLSTLMFNICVDICAHYKSKAKAALEKDNYLEAITIKNEAPTWGWAKGDIDTLINDWLEKQAVLYATGQKTLKE